jgi:hypothetical protein
MFPNVSRTILRFVSCDGGGGSGSVESLRLDVDGGREGGTRLGEAGTASECSIWYAATSMRVSDDKFYEEFLKAKEHVPDEPVSL